MTGYTKNKINNELKNANYPIQIVYQRPDTPPFPEPGLPADMAFILEENSAEFNFPLRNRSQR